MLDALIVMWSSICMRVDSIEASRVNDLSPFGPTVMTGQGVGATVEQFGRASPTAASSATSASPSRSAHRKGPGLKIEQIVGTREPIVTEVERSTQHVEVPAGSVAGCKQVGKGYIDGELKILDPPAADPPELANQGTGDYIKPSAIPWSTWPTPRSPAART